MPTTYAHWRFGDRALQGLPEKLKALALSGRELYDIGAQGPDVFFHYKCLKDNPVIRYGNRMHDTPMTEHLKLFRERLPRGQDREAALAYLMGFLSHYLLDTYCHGYIELKSEQEGPSHNKIEAQFDRFLLLEDGLDPYKTSVTFSLHPSALSARVMEELYGVFDEKVMYKAVKDQVFYRNLLRDSGDFKRGLLSLLMGAAGAGQYRDLMMGKGEHPLCAASNLRLKKYFDAAVLHYPILAENMVLYLEGKAQMDPYFRHDFGPKEDWREIPLLSAEDEADYQAGRQA